MRVYILLFIAVIFTQSAALAQKTRLFTPDKSLLTIINKDFSDADYQYKLLAANTPADKFPKTYFPLKDQYEFSDPEWWCSGFFLGTLLYIYEQTHDTLLLNTATKKLKELEKEQYNTNTHDLGFMMYCSFGNAYRLTASKEYKNILIASARSLSTRFNPKTGCIRSWNDKDPNNFLVIIDNMMNLELLLWAFHETGDSSFYKIATTHANTTMKNHFRSNYSSYHVVNYNANTGDVKQKITAQGAADSSAWARGQSWGLYGYTMMYRETKRKEYLEQANHIANFILSNPNFPADKIPYWDFDAPGIPNALRDASAAAIIASALLELAQYSTTKNAVKYFETAGAILRKLSGSTYKAPPGKNGGFILMHCVGHMPNNTEIDVPLSYADYYFVEAMKRYKKLCEK
jgi:unsaturated chondroitin disaccharide hydrolase